MSTANVPFNVFFFKTFFFNSLNFSPSTLKMCEEVKKLDFYVHFNLSWPEFFLIKYVVVQNIAAVYM